MVTAVDAAWLAPATSDGTVRLPSNTSPALKLEFVDK
jgi:hypothetical protein